MTHWRLLGSKLLLLLGRISLEWKLRLKLTLAGVLRILINKVRTHCCATTVHYIASTRSRIVGIEIIRTLSGVLKTLKQTSLIRMHLRLR